MWCFEYFQKRFLGGFPEAGNASASPGASSAGCEDRPDWPDGAGAGLVMPSASRSWMGQPCLTWPWVTELCRLVLWQVSLCRGQSPGSCHSRILPRVTSADAAAMAPPVQHGRELLRGSGDSLADLQGQNSCTATDSGESSCFHNKVCK